MRHFKLIVGGCVMVTLISLPCSAPAIPSLASAPMTHLLKPSLMKTLSNARAARSKAAALSQRALQHILFSA